MAFVREARMQIHRWKANRACEFVRLKHRSKDMHVAISNDAILTTWIRDLRYPNEATPRI